MEDWNLKIATCPDFLQRKMGHVDAQAKMLFSLEADLQSQELSESLS